MINILKEIILEQQESTIAAGVTRRVAVTPVEGKATICIGVRRGY